MKIFIIHKGSDYDRICELKKEICQKTNADLLLLSSTTTGDKWKREAKKKIIESDVILYMLGDESHSSTNVDFEIRYSIKHKKEILLCRLDPLKNSIINDSLYCNDKYMSNSGKTERKPLFKEINLDEFTNYVKNGYGFDIANKLDDTLTPKRKEDIIEQYKVYLETSEQILNRRQNTSTFYTTLNTSLLAFGSTVCGILFGLKIIENNILIASFIFFLISLLGIMLCVNWISLLESYGKLNSSKIRVISEIEKRLPINIYDTEWKVMSEKLGDKQYKSFTSLEKRIPIIFTIIYFIIIVVSIIGIITSLI